MSLAPETHHGFNLDNTKINGTSFECALCTFTPVVKIQTSTLHCILIILSLQTELKSTCLCVIQTMIASNSSSSVSRRLMHCSSSMAMVDSMPPEFHRWTARVQSKLVYPSSAGYTGASVPVRTRKTSNWQIDVLVGRHVRRNITLKPNIVSKNWDATGCQEFAQWCKTCMCLHVDITDDVKPVNS